MSINQFTSDLPDTIWWTQHHAMDPNSHTNNINTSSPDAMQHHHHKIAPASGNNYNQLYHHHSQWYDSRQSAPMVLTQNPSRNFNLNSNDVGDDEDDDRSSTVEQQHRQEVLIEKEGMFEKPLTPSDVGKLNRLVIPKQHAEKYFPLGGDSGDKGLLLGFEDESGKSWRFRYSYWNSSQSYVLTKGWSRYVKEKQLDAGDVVFFERHRTDGERFFIGWRRRNAAVQEGSVAAAQPSTGGAGADQWTRVFYPAHAYPAHHGLSPTVAVPYQHHCTTHAAGTGTIVPTTVPAGNLKRLRLFGVNMECHQSEDYEPSTPDGSSSVSSQGGTNYHHYQHYYSSQAYASNHQNQMDTSCSGDVHQQMRRGGRG